VDTITLGDSHYINSVIIPIEALDKNLTYSSSNTNALTVSPDGKITAVGVGQSTITVTTVNGKYDSFNVEVYVPLQGISINDGENNLVTGVSSAKFPNISYYPSEASNKNVTYKSSNPSIATIDMFGNITFHTQENVPAGEVKFTATSVDGEYSVDYFVNYTGGLFVSANINSEYKNMTIAYEDYVANNLLEIKTDVYPLNANMSNIIFTSSNPDVIRVVDNKLFVVGGGSTTIEMIAKGVDQNNEKVDLRSTASIFVTRKAQNISASNIVIDTKTYNLEYNVSPSDHTDKVLFSSSSNLATVSSSGVVTFNKYGSVIITITAGDVTKNITVTYRPNNGNIININKNDIENIPYKTFEVDYGKSYILLFDIDIDLVNYSYKSSDAFTIDESSMTITPNKQKSGVQGLTVIDNDSKQELFVVNFYIKQKVEEITVSSSDIDLLNQEIITGKSKMEFSSIIYPTYANLQTVTYTLSNMLDKNGSIDSSVATISDDGVLEFIKAGTVTVNIIAENVSKSYTITSTYGHATSITLNMLSSYDYSQGEVEISYTYFPSDANVENIKFTSSNLDVFKVENGKIILLAGGDSILSVYDVEDESKVLASKNLFISQSVERIDIANSEITIDTATYSIIKNTHYTIYPATATSNINFSSSDLKVARVTSDGYISFLGKGEAIITVYADGVENQIKIICDLKGLPVSVNSQTGSYELKCPNSLVFVEGNIAFGTNIEYVVENPDILKYNSEDQSFTAINPGTTNVEIYSDGNLISTFEITNIRLSEEIVVGEYNSLTALINTNKITTNVLPVDTTNKNLIYGVDDESIATLTIYSDGFVVNFKKAGTVNITIIAEDSDGMVAKTIAVTSTYGYARSASTSDLNVDYTEGMKLNIPVVISSPNDLDSDVILSNRLIEYVSSSNSNIIKINTSGELEVLGGGNVTITINVHTNVARNNPIILESNIYVNAPITDISIEESVNITEPEYQMIYQTTPTIHTSVVTFNASSNLANISDTGVVKFIAPGSVTITISSDNGVSKIVNITYMPETPKFILITADMQTVNISYDKGEVFGLMFAENLGFGKPEYDGYDENILSFNPNTFTFSAVGGGTTTIKASSQGKSVNIVVNVNRHATGIIYDSLDVDIEDNKIITSKKTLKINAYTTPNDATIKIPSFASSDSSIATVDASGNITFLMAGEVKITMTADSVTEEITISSSFGLPTNFVIDKNNIVIEDLGESNTIIIDSFAPSDYELKLADFTFTPSSNIVVINSEVVNGKINLHISGVSKGQTAIVVKVGNLTNTINVEVKVKTKNVTISYGSQTLSDSQNYKLLASSINLSCEVTPSNANNKNVLWSVISGSDIATVNENGIVTYTGYGVAVIRVATEDSGYSIYKDVTIERIEILNPDSIAVYRKEENVSGGKIKYLPNESEQLKLNVRASQSNLLDPENIDYSKMTYSYSAADGDDGLVVSISNDVNTNYFTIIRTDSVLKSMSATITFAFGEKSVLTTVKFYKITGVELPYSNDDTSIYADSKVGLEQKRVFGTYSFNLTGYDGSKPLGEFVNTLNLSNKVMSYPAGIQDELHWFVEGDGVTVNNGIITFATPEIYVEKFVTIRIGNESTIGECTVLYTYTMTIVRGVNIFNALDFAFVINQPSWDTQREIVMQNSIGTSGDGLASDQILNNDMVSGHLVERGIYGNGYTLNLGNVDWAEKTSHNPDFNILSFTKNLTIKGGDSVGANQNVICPGGELSYCKFINLEEAYVHTMNVTFYRCLFKDFNKCGILVGDGGTGTFTLIDTIFYNVGMCAVSYQAGTLVIKGFCDIHNWKTYNDKSLSTYKTVLQECYEKDSTFTPYIWKTDANGNSVSSSSSWQANIGIISPKVSTIFNKQDPAVDTVTFYDENNVAHANNINTSKLQFGKVSKARSLLGLGWASMHMWLTPVSSAKITPFTDPNEAKLYANYSA